MADESLSPDDLAAHRHFVGQLRVAHGALNSWYAYLSAKYTLGPQDRIGEDGAIARVPAVPPGGTPPAAAGEAVLQ